jgi:hypothetical protein
MLFFNKTLPLNTAIKTLFDRMAILFFVLGFFCTWADAAPTSELRFQRLASLGADQLSTISLIQDR